MMNLLDTVVVILFIAFVVAFSMYKSRQEATGEDYFLAGRGLVWWLIGFSLIAANVSTEQFVGMNGSAAGSVGFAIASYDWIAAMTLVIVALFFLPHLLRTGIYTIPEFLEKRYNATARLIMSVFMVIIYSGVTISAVLYSGGLTTQTIFGIDLTVSVWVIGIIAALYTSWGGLKAVVWADLFLGTTLIVGGFVVLGAGIQAIGGWDNLITASQDRFHMALPADHTELPWTALLLGIWIPNLYYWGFNQFIAQRTLAARSLKDGQLGVLMAASLQVILPLIIVVPGIIAAQLYAEEMATPDEAFPKLVSELIAPGLRGFIFAAILGAVISSLGSMLNSASTIFTMDIYAKYLKKQATQAEIIRTGRLMTVLFVLIGCLIAPQLGNPRFKGIFHFIQDFQGYVTPGILATFIFGFFSPRTPSVAAVTGLLINIPIYGILHLPAYDHIGFLNKMGITFLSIVAVMGFITWLQPLKTPRVMVQNTAIDLKTSPLVKGIGATIFAVTLLLYIIFW